MQNEQEQNRESNIGRRSSRDFDEDRDFSSGGREQYEGRGYGEQGQGREAEQGGRSFRQQEGRNFGERGPRSFRDDDDMFLERDRSGGEGRSRRAYQTGERYSGSRGQDRESRSPYGEDQQSFRGGGSRGGSYGGTQERDFPYRGADYRDYGYGAGSYGGGRRGYQYEGSAAYEGRGYGSDYDIEGRGGYENRGGWDVEGPRGYGGSGIENRGGGYGTMGGGGGYGDREPYESRDWGGRWNEGSRGAWSERGGGRESRERGEGSYSNIFERERGQTQGSFGGRGQTGAGQVVGSSRSDTSERSFRGTGPKGYSRSDESIHEDVCQRLEDADLDPSDVTVKVESGEVTLSGKIDSRWAKRYAEDIAYQIRGVNDVHNELRVESGEQRGTQSQSEERSAEEQRGNGRSMSAGSEQQQQPSMSS